MQVANNNISSDSVAKQIEKDINEEVLVYEYLLQHNIHAPEVIPSRTNEKVSIIKTGSWSYPAILMRFEKLKRVPASDLSNEQLHKIAFTVSHMHDVLIDYPRKEYIRPTIHDAMSIYNHSLNDF